MTSEQYHAMRQECYIDLRQPLPEMPIAISAGTHKGEFIPFGTYGNFSCITGPSKVGKTFFSQALMAAYLGGNARSSWPSLQGHNTQGKIVYQFDTEQSERRVQWTAKNVLNLCQLERDPELYAYALRRYTPTERVEFIRQTLDRTQDRGRQTGLVLIDGVADLLDDFNNLGQSLEVVQKLMTWTTQYNCHIVTVVHLNFGENAKPTGHIGTAITKKAETVAVLTNDADKEHGIGTVTVSPRYTRERPWEPIKFYLGEHAIPYQDTEGHHGELLL